METVVIEKTTAHDFEHVIAEQYGVKSDTPIRVIVEEVDKNGLNKKGLTANSMSIAEEDEILKVASEMKAGKYDEFATAEEFLEHLDSL